jgi:Protein of unknown function (DUF3761)
MKKFLIAAALLMPFGLTATSASAQAARNYDCTKAGNANKAVCKGAKPAAAPAARPAAPRPASKSTAAAPATRNYDCTKAGNANKAVCKGAAPTAAAPAARPATRTAAPAPRPAAPRVATGQAVNGAGPGGATAKCRDGSYSHSATRSGTCSRHGGVETFY